MTTAAASHWAATAYTSGTSSSGVIRHRQSHPPVRYDNREIGLSLI